jgi:tail lysozyme
MTVAAVILSFFIAHGAQPYQAHALVRQARTESGLDANPPKTGLGHCLYQWTGERWRQLRAWSGATNPGAKINVSCPPLERQLVFALAELREPHYACFWSAPPGRAYRVLRATFGAGARCR